MADRLDLPGVLAEIDQTVTHLFALIADGVGGATHALLAGDREAAALMAERERVIDRRFFEIEEIVPRQLAVHGPVSTDLQYLVVVLRIVPELERSGDLVAHVAHHGTTGLADRLNPRIRGLAEQAGAIGHEMWREVSQRWSDPRPGSAARLDELDEELDALHHAMLGELRKGTLPADVIVDMAFVSRFLERIGDHAANIAHRIDASPGLARSQATFRGRFPVVHPIVSS